MDCFSTLGNIERQKNEMRQAQKSCSSCKEFTEDKDFFVFGRCNKSGNEVAKNHICEDWIKLV